MKRLLYVAAMMLLLIWYTSPSSAQTITGPYWDNGDGMGMPIPALYFFRGDGTGVRTTYPQGGQLQFGTPYPFAWSFQGNVLVLQFASGYTDMFEITGYDEGSDVIARAGVGRSQQWGVGPWYGCASGMMPPMIASTLC
jgi:hypothetical protein